ncbi:MAG: fibronectin type III domain-containing protein [Planctomycetes bacterium]|nr:fibronectin type III domain-containing protein [Planctomycetota bacterium]
MVPRWQLFDLRNGYYYIIGVERFNTFFGDPGLCPDDPLYSQLGFVGGCSAFLIGPDHVATAGHCLDGADLTEWAFLFGYDQRDGNQDPELLVSADRVYFPVEKLWSALDSQFDHGVVRIDRPVMDRRPLAVQDTGFVAGNAQLAIIGNPFVLPTKVANNGQVLRSLPEYENFETNLDHLPGNSGSLVMNAATGLIEGILVAGPAVDYWAVIPPDSCFHEFVCPNNGGDCVSAIVSRAGVLKLHQADSLLACGADFDGNRVVDDSDFVAFVIAYNEVVVPPASQRCDLNGDGFVNDEDFPTFLRYYDEGLCPDLPSSPANVSTSLSSSTTAVIRWQGRSPSDSQYEILRSGDGKNFAVVSTAPANATSAPVSGLAPATPHWFTVRALNDHGLGPAGAVAKVRSDCPLRSPQNATITPTGPDSVRIQWQSPVGAETWIYVDVDPAFSLPQGWAVGVGQSSINFKGFETGTTYYFQLQSVDTDLYPMCNSPSTSLQFKICQTNAPTNFQRTTVGPTSIAFAWNDNSDDEIQFKIERLSGSVWVLQENVPPNATRATVTGLSLGQTYTFRIVADGPYCDSPSNSVTETTICNVAAPTGVQVLSIGAASAVIRWVDNSDNEIQFKIQRWNGSAWVLQENVPPSVTQATVTGLSPSASYRMRVVADGLGCDAVGGEVVFSTTDGCFPAPTSFRPASIAATSVVFAWSDNSGEELQFRIERQSSGSWVLQENVPPNATSATVTGLTLGATYKFRIVAEGQYCDVASNSVDVTTVCDTAPPSNFRVIQVLATSVKVAWNDNSNNEIQFRVQRLSGGTWVLQENVPPNATSATLTGLTVNTSYRFRVLADGPACDGVGNELTVTTQCDTAAPTSFRATSVGRNTVNVAWTDNSTNEVQFKIERWNGSSWVLQENVPANHPSAQLTGLSANTTYRFRCVADGPSCNSTSNEISVRTNP